MNEHLRPIFTVVLPAIESASIKYWVYGGVAIASVAGDFFRHNDDVDIFFMDEDFDSIKTAIEMLALTNKWRIRCVIANSRPKLELLVASKELLSLIPVYNSDDKIEFKFGRSARKFPADILQQVKRRLNGYEFLTPPDEFIKALFVAYLENRKDLRSRQRVDAEKILSNEEFKKYYA